MARTIKKRKCQPIWEAIAEAALQKQAIVLENVEPNRVKYWKSELCKEKMRDCNAEYEVLRTYFNLHYEYNEEFHELKVGMVQKPGMASLNSAVLRALI